jgi:Flp pilus assembly protein TadG
MFRRFISAARREEGAALLEAALTLPIMLLVCVGILEFGRAYQAWQVVTNASREGARVAVLPGISDDSVEARVKTYLQNGALDRAADADVIITNTTVDIGGVAASAASVQVDYPFEFMVLGPVAELVVKDSTAGEGFTMTASTIMRNE